MTITIRLKDQYGTQVAHPVCENAKRFAAIAGTKTLTTDAIQLIRGLGYTIRLADVSGIAVALAA